MSVPASKSDAAAVREALSVLGLGGVTDAAALKTAFRAAVKAARPDQAGGDAERFRRIIAAYRLIQAHSPATPWLAPPAEPPPPPPVLTLTPTQALHGAQVSLRLERRTVRVSVPAGMRTGEHLRLRGGGPDGRDLYLAVLIRPGDGLSAMGDDLYMDWPTSRRLLDDGGRIEIETHAGARSAWITPGRTTPIRLRLKDLGLPARGSRPAGHLFVTLVPSSDTRSAAEDLLAQFTRAWTPERMAA